MYVNYSTDLRILLRHPVPIGLKFDHIGQYNLPWTGDLCAEKELVGGSDSAEGRLVGKRRAAGSPRSPTPPPGPSPILELKLIIDKEILSLHITINLFSFVTICPRRPSYNKYDEKRSYLIYIRKLVRKSSCKCSSLKPDVILELLPL